VFTPFTKGGREISRDQVQLGNSLESSYFTDNDALPSPNLSLRYTGTIKITTYCAMLNRPLISKIILAALITLFAFLIALIYAFYYLFDGQLDLFLQNIYVKYLSWVIPIAAAVLGVIVRPLSSIVSFKSPFNPATKPTSRNLLLYLLDQVEQNWIEGMLKNSIHHAVLLKLGKESQPSQVIHPWENTLELPDQTARLLTIDTPIEQVFTQESSRRLLILGAPGAGKTTALLELAQILIEQARTDEQQPIPVIFNLSSWAVAQRALSDWLISELRIKYQIPQEIGTVWLQNHWILPLLDGLDEVQASARPACVQAINQFAQGATLTGLAVCCRRIEYEALSTQLQLNAAICLQPLRSEQIDEYVIAGGEELTGLQELLRQNAEMRELAQSPLMLNIMSLAYQNVPVTEVMENSLDAADNRNQLFKRYITKMFARHPANSSDYPKEKVEKWLSWLAMQMQQSGQSLFLVESLQPTWLPSQLGYRLLSGLLWGLFFLSFGSLLGTPQAEMLMISASLGIIFALLSGEIQTKETLGWSWEKLRQEWFFVMMVVLFLGLLSLPFGVLFSLFVGLPLGLLVGLLQVGLENQIPEHKIAINQGIVASFQNSLYFGIPLGLVAGIVLWLGLMTTGLKVVSEVGLLSALSIGIVTGFIVLGGFAVIQHYILRFMLWLEGYMPFNCVHFLDYSNRLILLHKVGGGYVFIDRMMLEHFSMPTR